MFINGFNSDFLNYINYKLLLEYYGYKKKFKFNKNKVN